MSGLLGERSEGGGREETEGEGDVRASRVTPSDGLQLQLQTLRSLPPTPTGPDPGPES